MSRIRTRLLIVLTLASLAGRCAADTRWKESAPEAQDLDPGRLGESVRRLLARDGVQSVLVARHGALVAERYARGGGRQRDVNVKSASKSVLSALVGIALAEGRLEGLDQPIADFLPELGARGVDPRKRAITIRHLLTMTAGLATTSFESYGAWVSSRDWVASALARDLVATPGSSFIYSTGNTHLLSAILTRASGMATREYAESRLFEPLGIGPVGWGRSPTGIDMGGNEMRMTARDLARFGQLYLDGGRAGARSIVPADWIRDSTRASAEGWPDRYGRYGYLWWIRPGSEDGAYLAVGYGGQFLYVAPRLDMVVVVTASAAGKGEAWDRAVLGILRDGILGAAGGT